jgi:hypothetical protein
VAYATLAEFIRLLRIEAPSVEQQASLQKCLDAATLEIDTHLSWLETPPATFTPEQQALLTIVNLDRASEHWRNTPFGALNTGPDLPPVLTARDSWYRHARKLASLKTSWGVS